MDSKDYWRESKDHKRKQSDPDTETYGDFCRALRESRKEMRSHQYDVHHEQIKNLGIPFELKNCGHHVIFNHAGELVDFWPASGKYLIRKTKRYGIGLHRLLKYFGVKA